MKVAGRNGQRSVDAAGPIQSAECDRAPLRQCSLRRERWLAAGFRATKALLTDTEASAWLECARAARLAAGAGAAAIWLPPADEASSSGLQLAAFAGKAPDASHVQQLTEPALYERICIQSEPGPELLGEAAHPSAVLVVPMLASDGVIGVLTLSPDEGASPPCPAEQMMVAFFCAQLALASGFAQEQRRQSRGAFQVERTRALRKLHNQVIQQLFGAGLTLKSVDHTMVGEPAKRVRAVVGRIDRIIVDIRRSQGRSDRTLPEDDAPTPSR